MRITVSDQNNSHVWSLGTLGVLLALGAAYFYIVRHSHSIAMTLAGAALALIITLLTRPQNSPVLVIDEKGVFDQRLGIGKVPWSDVVSVHFSSGYGNRFLCIRVQNPKQYVSRLGGARREKVVFNQSLGFKSFNIDIGDLEINLLDLKLYIEKQIPKQTAAH
jgi:hypothetical protein